MARTGRISAKVQRRGPAPAKKTSKAVAKKSSGSVTGHAQVAKWKKFIKVNASGGMVLDKKALENARAAGKAAARKPIAKPKSAGGGGGGKPGGGGGGANFGGPDSWKTDPNDSRNQPAPNVVEEQNRLRNIIAAPPMPQNQIGMGYVPGIPQTAQQSNQMQQQNYGPPMFNSAPQADYAYGMIDYQPVQPDYYGQATMEELPTRGGVDWRRPNQNQLGVMTPDEFVDTKSTQPEPEEGFLGFFSTLSTEEMIALACGGAGFLLFIIVIIVIIFKLRKKAKRKKKKNSK